MNKKKITLGFLLGALAFAIMLNMSGYFAASDLAANSIEIADSEDSVQVVDFRIDTPATPDSSVQVVDFRIDTPADYNPGVQVVPFRIDTPY